jgi:tetratricopeptide (TPR) repeat protein
VALLIATGGLLLAHTDARADEAADKRLGLQEIAQGFAAIERWHVDEARGIAERAYRDHPDYALTLALVAEVKMHMSDYAGAVDLFRRAKEAGAAEQVLQTEPLAEATLKATKDYDEQVGEHFILRYAPGKDAILIPYVMQTLEASRERIGALLGWKPEGRVVIEIYPSASLLAEVSTLTEQEIRASGTIALCRWNRLMVTSPRGVMFGYAWRDTMAHELTHLIIGGASANTVPIWLHEGIAKYAETAWRGEPGEGLSVEQQIAVREAAKKGKLIPFEKMHPSMAKLKSQEETSLAFAEVFTFIEFLVERKGWEGMRKVLSLMANGSSDEEAIESVHGKSLKALASEWMRTLKTREVRQGKRGDVAQTEHKVIVKSTPDAPEDQLHGVNKKGRRFARAADLLFARGRIKAAQKELEKAVKETGAPILSAKLAVVALASNDLDTAETAAKHALEGAPDLAGPNITLADILVRRQKMKEAKDALDRAIAVNPFDPRIHSLMLAALGPNGDAEERKHAELSMRLLAGDYQPLSKSAMLGSGGLIQIDRVPFSRVYISRGADDTGVYHSTGMVTPTGPIALKPGRAMIRLVPPVGKASFAPIEVLENDESKGPQRVIPDGTGS